MTAELLARRSSPLAVPAALGGLVVVAQVAYPLTSGAVRDSVTVAVVVLLACTCIAHAVVTRGVRVAVALVAVTAVPGFVAEVVGVRTGWPFGDYVYAASLGPRLWDVPVVVALAWTMLAWPAAVAARTVATGFGARVLVGTWALASTDLFLDPQMVGDGHWRWTDTAWHLPGVPDVALSNLAGWLAVSAVLSLALQVLLERAGPADDRIPVALYLWLYAGWIVALAVFLHLPAAAAWGAVGMGIVALPLAGRLRR